jgi:hypothetical protein
MPNRPELAGQMTLKVAVRDSALGGSGLQAGETKEPEPTHVGPACGGLADHRVQPEVRQDTVEHRQPFATRQAAWISSAIPVQ